MRNKEKQLPSLNFALLRLIDDKIQAVPSNATLSNRNGRSRRCGIQIYYINFATRKVLPFSPCSMGDDWNEHL
jgi:hypothetical protein